MSNRLSVFRIVMTLLFAAFIAVPQSMVAQDGLQETESVITETGSQQPDDVDAGEPGEGDANSGEEGEGETGDAGDEGNAETGDAETGDSEVDDAGAGEAGSGDAETGETGDGLIFAPAAIDDPVPTLCDPTTLGSGSVEANLDAALANGQSVDCIDIVAPEVQACGAYDLTLVDATTGMRSGYALQWVYGDTKPTAEELGTGQSLPALFAEDEGNGSVTITIYLVGPESDYTHARFIGEADGAYSWWHGTGVTVVVNTDCELPAEGFYCDYANLTGPGSVATWLSNAPEGANTDCIDVGEIDYSVCGQVTIPLTNNVSPWEYAIEYVEGTDIGASGAVVATGGVIAFPEDYNNGSVTVTAYIGGPEQDFVAFANEGDWAYAEGGMQITIETDCERLEVPEGPVVPNPAVCETGAAGRAYRDMAVGNDVTTRDFYGADGVPLVNVDSWGNTIRIWGATDETLTNATYTFNLVAGATFGDPGAPTTPGIGYPNVPSHEYQFPNSASGIAVTRVSDTQIAVTIGDMPAMSSWSANVPFILDEGSNEYYLDSTLLGDLVDCVPPPLEVPEGPVVPNPAVCETGAAGRAYRDMAVGNDVTTRDFYGADGVPLVNVDSWGNTIRIWGATDEPLTNATYTYNLVAGATFGDLGAATTPGIGYPNVPSHEYQFPNSVSGITITRVSDTQIVVTVANMPAMSSWSANVPFTLDEGSNEYYLDSTLLGAQTNCDAEVPALPGIPEAEVCQQVLAGRTITAGPNANVDVRDKFGVGGEVNADGWGTTFRLYGATDEPLTNVVATFNATQGFSFAGTYNSLANPGAGNLGNTGYTVPVDGITIDVTATTVTVTIESMPANSSWSFNVPLNIEIETGKLYMDSTMIGDLADCEPAVLELPTITASVCDDNYMPTPVSVTAPEDSESATYSEVTATNTPSGMVFSFTATVNYGYTLDGATIPDGWTVESDTVATFTSEPLTLADCEVPLEVVAPEVPVLVAATCGDDDAGETANPSLEIPETEGVTYGEVVYSPANSVKMTLTATADEGFTFAGATLPEGWTLVSSSEAVYEIVADTVDCPEEEDPGTPEDPETPEKPEEDKAPEVTGLPETGAGTSSVSTIGLAATAAAALAGAGLFFNNRRR